MADDAEQRPGLKIFKGGEAPDAIAAGIMTYPTFTPLEAERMKIIAGDGEASGAETRLLFNVPGFSLVHVWFKKHYPLPLHSHDADCLYYIIAGSLEIGAQTLGPRDGFFVGAGVPYAYKPGPEGVELLEFRHATGVDFQLHAHGEAFWIKAAEAMAANRADWRDAKMPALNV
jgi:hypothetical protein